VAGSHRTAELKVPTMAVGVRLALVAAQPAPVEMFLPDIPGRSHNQMLDDLASQLGGDARFVPVRMANQVRLVGKHAIAWIAVTRYPAGEAPEAPAASVDIPEELTLFDHQHFVEIELAHDQKLVGTLLDSESIEHSRLGDHLNRSGYWLRLWTPDQHYLVNAQQVVAVTELGEVW
jgi:hypothetical protein